MWWTTPTCFTLDSHTAKRRQHLTDAAAKKKSIGAPPPKEWYRRRALLHPAHYRHVLTMLQQIIPSTGMQHVVAVCRMVWCSSPVFYRIWCATCDRHVIWLKVGRMTRWVEAVDYVCLSERTDRDRCWVSGRDCWKSTNITTQLYAGWTVITANSRRHVLRYGITSGWQSRQCVGVIIKKSWWYDTEIRRSVETWPGENSWVSSVVAID